MILSLIYQNKSLYFHMMKMFLEKRVNAWKFREKYWHQRTVDLDEKKNGYTYEYYEKLMANLIENEKKFKKEYIDYLYNETWSPNCLEALKKYEKGAKKLDIKGEMFFKGIWNFIDEYIREYYPSDSEDFDPEENVDEKELEEKIKASYEVLARNKDRWLDIEEDKKTDSLI